MIDGIQLLTLTAIGFYMMLGAIIGFIAGLILIPGYCVVHPLVLSLWENHRMIVEKRKVVTKASKIVLDKIGEVNLEATKGVLKENIRDRVGWTAPPQPPPNVRGNRGSDPTNQRGS